MNVAQFKKRLIKGVTKLHAVRHTDFGGRDEKGVVIYKDQDLGIRTVSIVQSNSFALSTIRTSGEVVDSWCGYPKASEIIVNNENSITILEPDTRNGQAWETAPKIPVLTYTFVD